MALDTGTGHAAAFDRERRRVFLEKADTAAADEELVALRGRADAALGIDDALLRQALSDFGIGPGARLVRAATQGTFHRLFTVEEAGRPPRLLRVASKAGEPDSQAMALEARLASMLDAAGLLVPACEWREVRGAGSVRGVHLLARVEGTSLAELDADEARMQARLPWVGRFLRILHRLRGRGYGPLSAASLTVAEPKLVGVHARWDEYLTLRLDKHVAACAAAGEVTQAEAARIAALFTSAAPSLRDSPPALLHGDPGSQNFIVDAEAIRAVIDWEDALLGDPLFDVASLCTFHPERRHAAIWSGYGAAPAPGDETWKRFWLYFLRIALAKTVHRRRFGYGDAPGRAPAARRIQLALERLEEGP